MTKLLRNVFITKFCFRHKTLYKTSNFQSNKNTQLGELKNYKWSYNQKKIWFKSNKPAHFRKRVANSDIREKNKIKIKTKN